MPQTIRTNRLDLVVMTAPFIDSLLGNNRVGAEDIGEFNLPDGWPDDHDRAFLTMRRKQMRSDPESEVWLARAIVLRDASQRPMTGHIGFHGPPDDGSLEMGYTVLAEYRRHGIALEAAEAMMAWAQSEHAIQRFVVSVSPENAPSLALAATMGFRQIGEQWDDEDGLEYVFDVVR